MFPIKARNQHRSRLRRRFQMMHTTVRPRKRLTLHQNLLPLPRRQQHQQLPRQNWRNLPPFLVRDWESDFIFYQWNFSNAGSAQFLWWSQCSFLQGWRCFWFTSSSRLLICLGCRPRRSESWLASSQPMAARSTNTWERPLPMLSLLLTGWVLDRCRTIYVHLDSGDQTSTTHERRMRPWFLCGLRGLYNVMLSRYIGVSQWSALTQFFKKRLPVGQHLIATRK